MAVIDGTPDVVNIIWYAGDTLTIAVNAPAVLTDGKDWNAQVKASPGAATADATFVVTPPATSGGKAYITLPSAVTASLVANATPVRIKGVMVKQYVGVWDCQISVGGSDPVTTLARGSITIQHDVTRLVP